MKLQNGCMILLIFLWGCSTTIADNSGFVYSIPSPQEREKFKDFIEKGYIELGMTKQEVRASWGEPKSIKQKKYNAYDEVWVYVPNWKFKNYLYFKNGILVGGDPNPEDLI